MRMHSKHTDTQTHSLSLPSLIAETGKNPTAMNCPRLTSTSNFNKVGVNDTQLNPRSVNNLALISETQKLWLSHNMTEGLD